MVTKLENKAEIVREITNLNGRACLVRILGTYAKYYVVSSVGPENVRALLHDETLAFRSDAGGTITNWSEVAGGRGATREEVIAELEE